MRVKTQWIMLSCVPIVFYPSLPDQNCNTNVSFGAQCWVKEGIGASGLFAESCTDPVIFYL